MTFDIIDTNIDYKLIMKEIGQVKERNNLATFDQLHLQTYSAELVDSSSKYPYPENYYKQKLYEFCPFINSLIDKYSLYKTTVNKITPQMCLPITQHITKQIWIPLQVPEHCQAAFFPDHLSFEVGNVYIVNTLMKYSVFNPSKSSLLYLSGSIYT